ncbi:MAG TPA: SDR family NAD(P)-dependent oxidoreductase [Gemmatimonadaceae bacterium]|nr:SDR family NAD(P)-dependent oxidoreductase [Gemmatimonadaceae bacterium]
MSEWPIAIITGASRGIGRAIALRLADRHAIVAAARSREHLESLAGEIRDRGGRCTPVVLDLRDPDAIGRAFGGIAADVLVNNAGIVTLKPFLEMTSGEWHEMIDVNLNAIHHATRAVLPGMVQRRRGHVMMIGSIAGRSAFVGGTGYGATKHALIGLSESLYLEVRESGVKVSLVMPGSVATEVFADGRDTSWMLKPEDVAETVAHVLGTPDNVLVHRVEIRATTPRKK